MPAILSENDITLLFWKCFEKGGQKQIPGLAFHLVVLKTQVAYLHFKFNLIIDPRLLIHSTLRQRVARNHVEL